MTIPTAGPVRRPARSTLARMTRGENAAFASSTISTTASEAITAGAHGAEPRSTDNNQQPPGAELFRRPFLTIFAQAPTVGRYAARRSPVLPRQWPTNGEGLPGQTYSIDSHPEVTMKTFPAICRRGNDERALITRDSIRFEVRIAASIPDRLTEAPAGEWRQTPYVSSALKKEAAAMQRGLANPKTVRFWTYESSVGGWVRLALQDGQTLSNASAHGDSEGYAQEFTEWERDGDTVTCRSSVYSSDCDGRYEHHGLSHFHIDEAEADRHADFETDEIIMRPNWQRGPSEQRDHTAEAAGY